MKCQHCGKNEVNVHLRQSINGQTSEYALCSECAEKLGVGGMFADFGSFGSFGGMSLLDGFPFGGSLFAPLLGGMSAMGGTKTLPQIKRCSTCGSSFDDIANRGKAGCADCYELFGDRLAPTIERMHNRARHIGKLPGKAAGAAPASGGAPDSQPTERQLRKQEAHQADTLESLRARLRDAVAKEEYEQAAILRDRIKEMESK